MNGLNHPVEVGADVRVPESQRAEASSSKDRVAHRVMCDLSIIISMLAAVDLDDQAALETDEIEIEAEQRRLTAKMEAVGAHHPKLQPETRFLRGQGLPQLAGAFRCGSGLPHPGRFAAFPSP